MELLKRLFSWCKLPLHAAKEQMREAKVTEIPLAPSGSIVAQKFSRTTGFSEFKMPGKFKGTARSLADPTPPKPVIAPKPVQPEAPPPPKPEEPLPTPENRYVKITVREARAPAKPAPDTKDEDYKLTGAEIKGMSVGSKTKPKTFADARPPPRQQPLVANVKFVIKHGEKIIDAEAKFQTSEKLSVLYEFLEKEVFEAVENFELRYVFPATVIPRDNTKALAAMKIRGAVMLNVFVTGKATLKKSLG